MLLKNKRKYLKLTEDENVYFVMTEYKNNEKYYRDRMLNDFFFLRSRKYSLGIYTDCYIHNNCIFLLFF